MLHNEIKNKQNLLAELSHDVSRIFVNDPQAAAAYLEEAAERNSFKRIGVALTDGRAYTTDGIEYIYETNNPILTYSYIIEEGGYKHQITEKELIERGIPLCEVK